MERVRIQAVATVEYMLVLNPMRGGIEGGAPFGPFPSRAAAEQFLQQERVDTYSDDAPDGYSGAVRSYSKSYRKGGPLEWFNPPDVGLELNHFGHGLHRTLGRVTDVQELGPWH